MTRILAAIVVLAAAAAAVLTAVATAADYAVRSTGSPGSRPRPRGAPASPCTRGMPSKSGWWTRKASCARARRCPACGTAPLCGGRYGRRRGGRPLPALRPLRPESGEYQGQELSLYDPSALFRKRLARHQFDPQLPIRYRWLNVQSSLVLMAVDQSGNALIREAYDPASLYGRQPPAPMGTRNYPLDAEEGIWEAVIAGSDVAYATKSGKVFLTAEGGGDPVEVYPNRVLTELMYPLFLAPQGAG